MELGTDYWKVGFRFVQAGFTGFVPTLHQIIKFVLLTERPLHEKNGLEFSQN